MTKDKALEFIDMDTYKCATYCEDVIAHDNITGLIYAIYDDIEQQICSNCKHNDDSSLCKKGIVRPDDNTNTGTFGCNKFEPDVLILSTETKSNVSGY